MTAMDYINRISQFGHADGVDYLGDILTRNNWNNTRQITLDVARKEYVRIVISTNRNWPAAIRKDDFS